MKRVAWLFAFIILAGACGQQEGPAPDSNILLETDSDFSLMSENEGMNKAFYAYAHDEAVVLQDGRAPLKGKELLKETYWSAPDTGYILTWEPVYAEIAASGDLGYTYGVYTLRMKADGTDMKGTYTTIWKKDEQGSWKFVLDAGTQGLEEGGI